MKLKPSERINRAAFEKQDVFAKVGFALKEVGIILDEFYSEIETLKKGK